MLVKMSICNVVLRRFSYHEECEHGLAHVEAVPPVMVGDPSVTFTDRVHKPHQGLETNKCF